MQLSSTYQQGFSAQYPHQTPHQNDEELQRAIFQCIHECKVGYSLFSETALNEIIEMTETRKGLVLKEIHGFLEALLKLKHIMALHKDSLWEREAEAYWEQMGLVLMKLERMGEESLAELLEGVLRTAYGALVV